MATVDKITADEIVAGKYRSDNPVRIVKYTNAWGGESYGVEFGMREYGKYRESEFIRNPTVYWDLGRKVTT